jgi:hypothetical protein
MTELTDRYVAAVLRGVPETQRADVERELRASVADAVDGMLEQGAEPSAAERSVLTDLGDPARLSADYSDRPLYLIGPALYLDYVRLLRVLIAIVVPIAAVGAALAQALTGGTIGQVVAGAITTALGVLVHLGFWVTIVFFLLERSGAGAATPLGTWSLDRLPELPARRQGLVDAVSAITWIGILIALLVGQQFFLFLDGRNVPALNPDHWAFWFPVLILLLLAEIGVEVARFRTGRWTVPLAAVNAVLNVAGASVVIALLWAGTLLNAELFAVLGWADDAGPSNVVSILVTIAMIGIAGFSIVDAFVRAIRRR